VDWAEISWVEEERHASAGARRGALGAGDSVLQRHAPRSQRHLK
jgi:hypothetical protein